MLFSLKRSRNAACFLILFSAVSVVSFAQPAAPFKVLNTWKLGGDGSWDYLKVDESAHLLYIARLNRIMVVDTQTGKLVTQIGGLQHAHGVALDDSGKMTVLDSESGKLVATAPIGEGADAVAYDSRRGLVLSSNGESGSLTILHQDSPDHYTLLQTMTTLPGARTIALNSTNGEIYTVSATH